jgi:hypothetical protein
VKLGQASQRERQDGLPVVHRLGRRRRWGRQGKQWWHLATAVDKHGPRVTPEALLSLGATPTQSLGGARLAES